MWVGPKGYIIDLPLPAKPVIISSISPFLVITSFVPSSIQLRRPWQAHVSVNTSEPSTTMVQLPIPNGDLGTYSHPKDFANTVFPLVRLRYKVPKPPALTNGDVDYCSTRCIDVSGRKPAVVPSVYKGPRLLGVVKLASFPCSIRKLKSAKLKKKIVCLIQIGRQCYIAKAP